MSDLDARPMRWLSALVAALVLAVGAAACGDSSSGDTGADDGTAEGTTERQAAATGSGSAADRREIAATMVAMREIYNDTNGKAFCSNLSPAGKREVLAVARSGDYAQVIKSRDCAGIVTDYSRAAIKERIPQRPVEVRRVKVNGDKATIVIKGGLAGLRSIVPFRFVRAADGKWKLVDPISGTRNTIRVEAE